MGRYKHRVRHTDPWPELTIIADPGTQFYLCCEEYTVVTTHWQNSITYVVKMLQSTSFWFIPCMPTKMQSSAGSDTISCPPTTRSSPEMLEYRILTYLNVGWNNQNISVTILAHASCNKHDVLTLFMVRMFFILSSDKSSGCSMLTSNTHFIHTLLLQLFPSMLSCSWFGVRKGRRYAPQIPVHAMVASASVQLQVWTQKWLLVSWCATDGPAVSSVICTGW